MKLNKTTLKRFAKRRERLQRVAEELKATPVESRWEYLPANHEPSEFEIQSFIYEGLKQRGFKVRGEVPSRCGTCVFDVVVYKDDHAARIIEVKKTRGGKGDRQSRRREHKHRVAQIERYSQFGIPVDLVCTLSAAKLYVTNFSLE